MKQEALNLKRQSISFYDALRKQGLSIIGEFKKASPSHGKMDNKIDLTERIRQYSESGVEGSEDVKPLADSRADALLCGTVLMEALNPKELIREFKDTYDKELLKAKK
jgi:indole-3-glycerol phosphate synthase